jgi:hypothetical protein
MPIVSSPFEDGEVSRLLRHTFHTKCSDTTERTSLRPHAHRGTGHDGTRRAAQGKYSDHAMWAPTMRPPQGTRTSCCGGLLWATKNASYLSYLNSLGANDGVDMFSWDNKLAGARVLLSRVRNTNTHHNFHERATPSSATTCSRACVT